MLSFGEQVRARREAKEITQQQLAARVQCSLFTVQSVESDRHPPSLETLLSLVRELDGPFEFRVGNKRVLIMTRASQPWATANLPNNKKAKEEG